MANTANLDRLNSVVDELRDAQWHADLASHFWKAGDLSKAAATIGKAEDRFGSIACVRLMSARINFSLGDNAAVRADLKRAVGDPKATFKNCMGVSEIYEMIEDDDSALELLNNLGREYSHKRFGAVAFKTAMSIYIRRGETLNALDAGISASATGGNPVWTQMSKLILDADLEMIERCRTRMRELEADGIKNGFSYKLMSQFDSRAGDRVAMLKHMTLGAKTRFMQDNPDIAWVDDVEPLKPSFIIIGGMKCGSTSLFDQISHHPLCLAPMNKELQFFQHEEMDDQWYLNHFPRVDSSAGYFSGESSPGYFSFDIVEHVKKLLPETKLLFIKRDPVDRAISHFRHNVRLGMSTGSIDKVMSGVDELQDTLMSGPDEAEEILMRRRGPAANAFLLLGCYEILLRRWYTAFPKEQFLELNLEDFYGSPQETMDQAFAFLGVDSIEVTPQQSNQGDYAKRDPETQRVMSRLREFYDAVATLA